MSWCVGIRGALASLPRRLDAMPTKPGVSGCFARRPSDCLSRLLCPVCSYVASSK